MLLIGALVLGSCKKCKKKDCQNDASCSLLNNEAVCACKDFYEGDRCETEIRSTYVGVYTGTPKLTYGGVEFKGKQTDYSVEKKGSSETDFIIQTTDTATTAVYNCKLSTNSDFTITSIDIDDPNISASGSGTIATDKLSFSGTISEKKGKTTYKTTFVINAYR